jgi:hypothetical protein
MLRIVYAAMLLMLATLTSGSEVRGMNRRNQQKRSLQKNGAPTAPAGTLELFMFGHHKPSSSVR